jgi:hypothetical protein
VREFGPLVDPVLTDEAGVVGVAGEELRVPAVDNEEVDPFVSGCCVAAVAVYPPRPSPKPIDPYEPLDALLPTTFFDILNRDVKSSYAERSVRKTVCRRWVKLVGYDGIAGSGHVDDCITSPS